MSVGQNRNIGKAKRTQAMAKTGGLCWYCGDQARGLDHVEPFNRPKIVRHIPRNNIGNLLPACDGCNQMKRNATLDEFRACLQSFFSIAEFRFWGEQFLPLERA